MSRMKIHPQTLAAIQRLGKEGYSLRKIGRLCGVAEATVKLYLGRPGNALLRCEHCYGHGANDPCEHCGSPRPKALNWRQAV